MLHRNLIALVLVSCGDSTQDPDAACMVGAWCGNDCLANDDACWACGELRYNAECQCRPAASTCFRPDCTDPSPGTEGDYCGTYWWCDRACGAGLQCVDKPDDDPLSYVRTCQPL